MAATVQQQASSRPTFSNPEGVLMLAIAFFADFIFNIGAIILYPLFGFGEVVSWAGDILFTATLGLWIFMRGGQGTVKRGKMGEFFKKRFVWIAAEWLPIIGILLPAWTINVILFLRQGGGTSKVEGAQGQPQASVASEAHAEATSETPPATPGTTETRGIHQSAELEPGPPIPSQAEYMGRDETEEEYLQRTGYTQEKHGRTQIVGQPPIATEEEPVPPSEPLGFLDALKQKNPNYDYTGIAPARAWRAADIARSYDIDPLTLSPQQIINNTEPLAGEEEQPTVTAQKTGIDQEPTPIGSRGFTMREDLDVLPGSPRRIFALEHPDGRVWNIYITQNNDNLKGDIVPFKEKGGGLTPVEKRLMPPEEQIFSRSELLQIVSYLAKTYPAAKMLSGLRETVGHAKIEQSINLERFRKNGSAPTSPPALSNAAPLLRSINAKAAEPILREAEMHGDAIGGQLLTNETLAQEGLQPKYEITIGPTEIEISAPYDAGGGRVAAVAYTHDEGKTTARTYYQGDREGIWRYLPDYKKEGEAAHAGAGYGAASIALPIAMQMALGQIAQQEKPKAVKNPDVAFLGTTREYGKRLDDFYKKVTPAGSRLAGNFYPAKPNEKTPPEQMTLNAGQTPDFNALLLRWKQSTRIYGSITAEVFPSKDGTLRFLFCKDARKRAWIGSVEYAGDTEVTSLGIKPLWINGGDLTTPAYEYPSRVGEYGNPKLKMGKYIDMYENYVSKIPIIREYKKRRENSSQPLLEPKT